jgi:hypothetical protein
MPRVTFVKSARKANPVAEVGQPYYWWKFRYGGKRYSTTRPKPSQLTQSAYFGGIYSLIEAVEAFEVTAGDDDAVDTFRDDIVSQLQEIADECEASRDNMPESLQDSPTGELLQERYDACEAAISEIENIEAPYQWSEVRDAQEEYQNWVDAEPDPLDFEDEAAFNEAQENWGNDEPDEPVEFEDFDKEEIIDALNNCIV